MLLGRTALALEGVGVDALAPDASVGDDILQASREETEVILRAHGSSDEVDEALRATGGWIAGLVFETWRTRLGQPSDDGQRLARSDLPPRVLLASALLTRAST